MIIHAYVNLISIRFSIDSGVLQPYSVTTLLSKVCKLDSHSGSDEVTLFLPAVYRHSGVKYNERLYQFIGLAD